MRIKGIKSRGDFNNWIVIAKFLSISIPTCSSVSYFQIHLTTFLTLATSSTYFSSGLLLINDLPSLDSSLWLFLSASPLTKLEPVFYPSNVSCLIWVYQVYSTHICCHGCEGFSWFGGLSGFVLFWINLEMYLLIESCFCFP